MSAPADCECPLIAFLASWRIAARTGLLRLLTRFGPKPSDPLGLAALRWSEARVLRSGDGGRTWAVAKTSLDAGPSAGIFSIAFSDARNGIIVGGDYKAEIVAGNNAAITTDGGATWTAVKGLSGFRSVAAYAPGNGATIVAVGPAGTDVSNDGGRTWSPLAGPGFHAFSFARRGTVGFGVGEKGGAAKLARD